MGQVLVLDISEQAIARVPWQTAIVWVLDRVADVVSEYDDKSINTVNWSVKMPSIVKFVKPIPRKRAVKFSRDGVYLRDRKHCQYCGQHVPRERFTIDHVIPRTLGGDTVWSNVVCSCGGCNQKKAGRTPQQAGMRLLSVPVKPKSLPDSRREITFASGMPDSWQLYLRSKVYWEAELENDNSDGA